MNLIHKTCVALNHSEPLRITLGAIFNIMLAGNGPDDCILQGPMTSTNLRMNVVFSIEQHGLHPHTAPFVSLEISANERQASIHCGDVFVYDGIGHISVVRQ